MTRTRSDMAAYIKERSGCTMQKAEQSALLAVEWLLNAVGSGDRVELRGFGSFRTVKVPEHKSNLPGCGTVAARTAVRFRPSEALKRIAEYTREESDKDDGKF